MGYSTMKKPFVLDCPTCKKIGESMNYFSVPNSQHEIFMVQCSGCNKYYEVDTCHEMTEEVKL